MPKSTGLVKKPIPPESSRARFLRKTINSFNYLFPGKRLGGISPGQAISQNFSMRCISRTGITPSRWPAFLPVCLAWDLLLPSGNLQLFFRENPASVAPESKMSLIKSDS